jgi:WD40 repeat protein
VAIAPYSTWLVTNANRTAQTWDATIGRQRVIEFAANAVAVAPDGNWLATSTNGTLRISDPLTGAISAVMRVDSDIEDCVWSPSGQLLAAAGSAGLFLFAFNF